MIDIDDVTPRKQYSATSGQTVFIYNYPIKAEADLKVYQRAASATPNDTTDILTLTVDYTVTGVGVETGGTIVLVVGATLNDVITIERDMALARESVYTLDGAIKSADLEEDLDKETMFAQDNEMHADVRNLSYPRSAVIASYDRILPILTSEKGWRMNVAGTALEAVDLADTEDVQELKDDLASHAAGKGASMIGLVSPSTSNLQQWLNTVEDMAYQLSSSVSITGGTISGITDLAISDGGTNAGTASQARANLGLQIGTDVQAHNVNLDQISAIAGTGLVCSTNSGFTVRELIGTTNEINITNGNAAAANPTIGLFPNPTIPGAAYIAVPRGTTAERPSSPIAGMYRYDTTASKNQVYQDGLWQNVLGADEAAPRDGTYITQTPDTAALPNAQSLSLLSTGLMKSTTTTGVVSTITDNSTFWDDAYTKRVDTWSTPLVLSSNTASIGQSSGSTDGYLSSVDWNTFDSKMSPITWSAPLVYALGIASITLASTGADGYLSSTDWNTFNNKLSAITWGDGLTYSAPTASVDFNTTNLKITTAQINTIQDIAPASSPTLTGLTLSGLSTANGLVQTDGSGILSSSVDLPTATTIGTAYVYRVGGTDIAQNDGGTAIDTSAVTNGQLLIGNTTSNVWALSTLTAGEAIDITNAASSITIDAEDATDSNKGVATFNDNDFVVTSADVSLANNFRHKNVIIGGDFSLNPWQRATTFTAAVANAYSADRFLCAHSSATLVFDITKASSAPTVVEAGILSNHSLRLEVTTNDASIDATDTWHLIQHVEGCLFTALAQRSMTLSFWVRSNKTGTYCIALRNSGLDRYFVSEYTISSSATWEKKTINITASPSAGTWDYTNGIGLRVNFICAAGSNAQTATLDAWATGSPIASSNQVNLMDTIGNYLEIDLIQLESGDKATSFEKRSRQEELISCERYYEKSFNQGIDPVQNSGVDHGGLDYRAHTSAAVAYHIMRAFHVTKRANPTVTFYNISAANNKWRNASIAADSGTPALVQNSQNQLVVLNPQVAGDNATNRMVVQWAADSEL